MIAISSLLLSITFVFIHLNMLLENPTPTNAFLFTGSSIIAYFFILVFNRMYHHHKEVTK